MQQRQRRTRPAVPPYSNQRPRCKQRGIKLAALQSSGVFDPRGSRQISMQAWLLGSLLAGIKKSRNAYNLHSGTDSKRIRGTTRIDKTPLPAKCFTALPTLTLNACYTDYPTFLTKFQITGSRVFPLSAYTSSALSR